MTAKQFIWMAALFIRTLEIPLFYRYFFPVKKKARVLVWFFYVILFAADLLCESNPNLNILITWSFLIAGMWFYEGRLQRRCFITVVVYVMGMISEVLASVIISCVYEDGIRMIMLNKRMLGANIISLILNTALLLIACKMVGRQNGTNVPLLYWIAMIATPVCSAVAVYIFFYWAIGIDSAISGLLPLMIVGLLLLNYVNLYLYNRVLNDQKTVLLGGLQQKRIEYYQENIDVITQSEQKTSKARHDMSHAMVNALSSLEEGDVPKAMDIINDTLGGLNLLKGPARSGNLHIDGILNYKIHKAAEMGIETNLMLHIPYDLDIPSADMSFLLGNAMDNAMEACVSVTDRPAVIDIGLWQHNRQVFLEISNPYAGEIVIRQEQIIETTKKREYGEHGIGLPRIKEIAEKYDGEMFIEVKDGIFTLRAQLG